MELVTKAEFGIEKGILKAKNVPALYILHAATENIDEKYKGINFSGAYFDKGVTPALLSILDAAGKEAPLLVRRKFARVAKLARLAVDKTHGDLVVSIDDPQLPKMSKTTLQEELAHRNNARSGAKTIFVEIAVTPSIKKSIANLSEGYDNLSPRAAVDEVIAKSFRDDAEEELNLTDAELVDNWESLFIGMEEAGQDIASYAKGVENVSSRGKRFADLARQRAPRNVETQSGRTAEGGDPARDIQGARQTRTRSRTRDEAVGKDDRFSKLRQAEIHSAGRGSGEVALQKAVDTDILFARGSWGKVNINGKTYDLKETVKEVATDLVNSPRAIKASSDLSAAGRQGLITSINHPVIAGRAFLKQLTMLPPRSGARAFARFKQDLNLHPYIELAEASDLHLTTMGDGALSHREEAFMSKMLGDDPYFSNDKLETVRKGLTFPVRASERAYVSYLDYLRINTFGELAKEVHRYNASEGKPDEQSQYTALAGWINRATGRGDLGRFNDAAPLFNGLFFSTRYWASRLQVLNPKYYAQLPKGVRKAALREMLIFAGAVAGLMAILKAAGFDVEMGDEDNPDLMKLRMGNYTYDFTAGTVGHARYLGRMIKSAVEEKDPSRHMIYLTQRYLRAKLAPIPSAGVNARLGSDYIGQPTSVKEEAAGLLKPIMLDNFIDAAKADGTLGILKTSPEFFGLSTTRYGKPEEYDKKIEEERQSPTEDTERRVGLWQKMRTKSAKFQRPSN
jgi:hypothetical protein